MSASIAHGATFRLKYSTYKKRLSKTLAVTFPLCSGPHLRIRIET
jgi:hypothetical protein